MRKTHHHPCRRINYRELDYSLLKEIENLDRSNKFPLKELSERCSIPLQSLKKRLRQLKKNGDIKFGPNFSWIERSSAITRAK